MILVTGATGKSGREIVKQLSEAGAGGVRALVRDQAKAQAFKSLSGVELVEGDLSKPETLGRALEGIEHVLLNSSPAPDLIELQGNLIAAAKRAGVSHIVKFSAQGADANAPEGFLKWHGQVEQRLAASGLAYTNLQPTVFMQEILNSWGGQRTISLPMKDAKVSAVDTRDIAAVAVKTLIEDGHAGKNYVITGPEALSFTEIAKKISAATGEEVNYVNITLDDFQKSLLEMGLPHWLAGALSQLYDYLGSGLGGEVSDVVAKVGKKRPISFDEFAREHAQSFKGQRQKAKAE